MTKDKNINVVEVTRMNCIDALKKQFTSNNAASWRRNSKKQLGEWYAEYILNDRTIKVKII